MKEEALKGTGGHRFTGRRLRLSPCKLSVTETSRREIFFTPTHIKLATDSHHHPPSIPRHATSFQHVSFATRCRESACFHPKSRGTPSFLLFLSEGLGSLL